MKQINITNQGRERMRQHLFMRSRRYGALTLTDWVRGLAREGEVLEGRAERAVRFER